MREIYESDLVSHLEDDIRMEQQAIQSIATESHERAHLLRTALASLWLAVGGKGDRGAAQQGVLTQISEMRAFCDGVEMALDVPVEAGKPSCFECGETNRQKLSKCAGCSNWTCDMHSDCTPLVDGPIPLCFRCIAACDVAGPEEGPRE